ncbi:MAG: ATP-binding protein, partial [Pseudomonadota bacterium]
IPHQGGKTALIFTDQVVNDLDDFIEVVSGLTAGVHGPAASGEVFRENRTHDREESPQKLRQAPSALTLEIEHLTNNVYYFSLGDPLFLMIKGRDIFDISDLGACKVGFGSAVKEQPLLYQGSGKFQEQDKIIFIAQAPPETGAHTHPGRLTLSWLKDMVNQVMAYNKRATVSEIIRGLSQQVIGKHGQNRPPAGVSILGLELENHKDFQYDVLKPIDGRDISRLVDQLAERIEQECLGRGFDYSRMRIRSVLEEAVLNAWIHGNKQDPNKTITVRWRCGNEAHLEVIDEGQGFDWENVPDPTLKENICQPNGRGIFIMRYFAGNVYFKNGGRCLAVTFRKQADPAKWPA